MVNNYTELTGNISHKLKELYHQIPDTMLSFSQLANATHEDGALSVKMKELIATAVAVVTHCQGCLGFHAQACVRLGVTPKELEEMLQVAIYMGGGPAVITAAELMLAYEEFGGAKKS